MSADRTLVIGLGNPILGDDGVGWVVAERIRQRVRALGLPVEVGFASLGGLSLMERLIGFQTVILVDALYTGQTPAGAVSDFPLSDLADPAAGHSGSIHDTSLLTALETGRRMGADLPERVHVVAVEAVNVSEFSEQLSPPVAAAAPAAVERVMGLLSSILAMEALP